MRGTRNSLLVGLSLGILVSVVFVVGFVAGTAVDRRQSTAALDASDPNVKEFLYAYHLVTQRSYFRPFNKHQLVYAAIDGMLSATGDPHTLFLAPSENRVANTQLNGSHFSGIGAMVVPIQGALKIVAPLPDSPAGHAGLQPGDIVIAIDGHSLRALPSERAVQKIHGTAGSRVRLTVIRGRAAPFNVVVLRAQIPPVTAYGVRLPGGVGYIQIMSFGDTTADEVTRAIAAVSRPGLKSLVIDLRQNPGGYVDAAQHIVSQFITHGVVAYERSGNNHLQVLPVVPMKQAPHVPIAILVDSGSASAAEITAAALHDEDHAILVGTRTYGKGSMQSVYTLNDGSSIRITDRLWLTPRKQSISHIGLKPDIAVKSGSGTSTSGADVTLNTAERYLQSHPHR